MVRPHCSPLLPIAYSSLTALALMKRVLRSAAGRRLAPVISGHIHCGQLDTVAAPGAVIVVVLQSYDGNARLRTTMGASYICFTSCHTRIPFLSRAYPQAEKAFLPRDIHGIRLIFFIELEI